VRATKLKKQNQKTNGDRKWDTVDNVTERYPLSRGAIYLLIKRGKLESRLLDIRGGPHSGIRLINTESLERLIEKSPSEPKKLAVHHLRKAGHASAKAAKLAHAISKRRKGRR
jgi:hypothetical protein